MGSLVIGLSKCGAIAKMFLPSEPNRNNNPFTDCINHLSANNTWKLCSYLEHWKNSAHKEKRAKSLVTQEACQKDIGNL